MANISIFIFCYEIGYIVVKILPKFVPKIPINNPGLCEMMTWWQTNEMPLSEPMMH